jgi:hypothetical protein
MGRAIFFNSLLSSAKWGVAIGIVMYFIESITIDLIITKPNELNAF